MRRLAESVGEGELGQAGILSLRHKSTIAFQISFGRVSANHGFNLQDSSRKTAPAENCRQDRTTGLSIFSLQFDISIRHGL